MTPTSMAEIARGVADKNSLGFEVMDNSEMRQRGMGAFMGVAQGSDEPAKLIILTYEGDPTNPNNNLGLIGKGITFDTGGISLKPAAGMEYMKGDMAGGASVIAAMQIISQLKPQYKRDRNGCCHRKYARWVSPAAGRFGHSDEW